MIITILLAMLLCQRLVVQLKAVAGTYVGESAKKMTKYTVNLSELTQ